MVHFCSHKIIDNVTLPTFQNEKVKKVGAVIPEHKPIPMPIFPIERRLIKIITEDFKFPESFEDDVNRAIMDGWKLDDLQIVSNTFVAFLSKIESKEREK